MVRDSRVKLEATDATRSHVGEDALLGGRVRLLQPKQGYRTAIEPVLLAAAIRAKPGEAVLDAGSGVGAAALCLAGRLAGVRVTGIERAADLVALAERNAALNGVADRVVFTAGDILSPPPAFAGNRFDHAMANPPFLEAAEAQASPHPGKTAANRESGATLADWVEFCLARLRARGTFTLIHRADRIDDVIAALHGRLGGIVVFPLWPGPTPAAQPAKRILVQGRKAVASPAILAGGLVLHDATGAFTPETEAVLRHGQALDL